MSKSRRHQNGRHPHAHFPEKRHAQELFRIRQTGTRRNVSHCRKILKAKKKTVNPLKSRENSGAEKKLV